MDTEIKEYIKRSRELQWVPLEEPGINTAGIYVKSLRRDEEGARSPSFLLKFEPGSQYPFHNHPEGEEILVLKGTCQIEGQQLNELDYLYTPPGFKHSVRSEKGCILFLMVPAEVEIIR